MWPVSSAPPSPQASCCRCSVNLCTRPHREVGSYAFSVTAWQREDCEARLPAAGLWLSGESPLTSCSQCGCDRSIVRRVDTLFVETLVRSKCLPQLNMLSAKQSPDSSESGDFRVSKKRSVVVCNSKLFIQLNVGNGYGRSAVPVFVIHKCWAQRVHCCGFAQHYRENIRFPAERS